MARKAKNRAGNKRRTKPRARRAAPLAQTQQDKALRRHLLYLLGGGGAHVDFEKAFRDFPVHLRGSKPAGLPYSAWQLLEHLRIAQWDILEFSRNPGHVSPPWPEGYWPTSDAPSSAAAWNASLRAFRADLEAIEALVKSSSTDLYARIPSGEGQTLLREALLVADHNAYHVGQVVLLRRLLGAWQG